MVAIATLPAPSPTSEAKKAYLREWRRRNADKVRADRLKNRERTKANKAAWYEANKELVAEYNRRYLASKPDAKRRGNQSYRARKRDQWVEAVDPKVLFDRDQGICVLCDTPVDPDSWWIEHLVPISRGGEHSYANTAVSHQVCNQRKRDRLLTEFNGGGE